MLKPLRRIRKAEETGAFDLIGLGTLNRLPPEVEHLTSLQSLSLYGCRQLSGDLSPLARLTSLQSLDLTWCEQLSGDLSPLSNLTSLQSLNLSGCKQLSGDLSPLANLTLLQSLDLSDCLGVRRFAPLESLLSTLKDLRLFDCKFDDLPAEVGLVRRSPRGSGALVPGSSPMSQSFRRVGFRGW
jgi:hypothetical protein